MTEHGTRSRYAHGRCRCDACKGANRDYMKAWRLARRAALAVMRGKGPNG